MAHDQVSMKQLRDVVVGRNRSLLRSQAMELLMTSNAPNKLRDFRTLLENENESSVIRYLAALYLTQIHTPRAVSILINNIHIRDERVLAGIMKGLGRIGNRKALEAISNAKEYATGFAAVQADFAATLISHRLGLKGEEEPVPAEGEYLEVTAAGSQSIQLFPADDGEAEFCLRCLESQPFGIEFTRKLMYQIHCEQRVWMIVFNSDFAVPEALKLARNRKAFPAIIARKYERTGLYTVTFLVLTSPAKIPGAVNIHIHRSNGDLMFEGSLQGKKNGGEFFIASVISPGVFPLRIEGTFEDGRLEFQTALSGVAAHAKREPIPETD
jgi:hypothetical protein